MKIVILGDTHFGGGYSLGKIDTHRQLNSRLIDFFNTFDYVVDFMISNSVKHFVITGDIFESRRPQASEVAIFSEKLNRLSELGIHTHIVTGNHDTIQDQNATTVDGIGNLRLPRVHIYSNIDSARCNDKEDFINLIFFPFRTRQSLGCLSNDDAVNRLKERLKYETSGISEGRTLLIGHFMLQGTVLGDGVAEGNSSEVALPVEMFEGLDGVIMGHVHPHKILQETPLISYVGSMDRKDFGDAKDNKYFLTVDVNEKDMVFSFEELPIRKLYDLEIDLSDSEDATQGCKDSIRGFAKLNKMFGSILRLGVLLSEKSADSFNRREIESYIKKEFKVHNCLKIYTQIASKRQLRNANITERSGPVQSFKEYLKLIDNEEIREQMKTAGFRIIGEVNNT